MNRIDQYISAVLSHLPVSEEARSRVAADLRAHLDESVASGLSEDDAVLRMGPPAEVAAELMGSLSPAYAPHALRLGAAVLDLTLIWGVAMFLMLRLVRAFMAANSDAYVTIGLRIPFVGSHTYGTGSVDYPPGADTFSMSMFSVYAILLGLSPFLYFVLFEWLAGGTPGKLLFRLRVARENASAPGLFAAFVRRISIVVTPLFVLDAAAVLTTGKRQRASDMIARTFVLESAHGPPLIVALIGLAVAAAWFVYNAMKLYTNPMLL